MKKIDRARRIEEEQYKNLNSLFICMLHSKSEKIEKKSFAASSEAATVKTSAK